MIEDVSDLLDPPAEGDGILTHSNRVEAFCQVYASSFSLTKASEAGGYLPQDGWQMLRRPNVAARILELANANGLNVNPGEVITHMKAIGFATPLDIVDPEVLKAAGIVNLSPELQMAIKSFDFEIDHYDEIDGRRVPVLSKVKFQWFDKLKALEMLSRVLELLKDSIVVTDPDGQPLGTAASKLSSKELDIKLQQFAARVMRRLEKERDSDE